MRHHRCMSAYYFFFFLSSTIDANFIFVIIIFYISINTKTKSKKPPFIKCSNKQQQHQFIYNSPARCKVHFCSYWISLMRANHWIFMNFGNVNLCYNYCFIQYLDEFPFRRLKVSNGLLFSMEFRFNFVFEEVGFLHGAVFHLWSG